MSKSERSRDRAQRAAAALAAQRARERRRNLLAVIGVVVAMALIVGGGFLLSSRGGGGPTAPPTSSSGGSDGSDGPDGSASAGGGLVVGPDSAPHKVTIYEDFLCPYCGMFEQASHADLAALAADGKVQLDYRPFHLLSPGYSAQALEVFEAVLAQGDAAVAKRFHDELYTADRQPSEQGPFPSQDDLVSLAGDAGADKAAIQQALDDGSARKAAEAATSQASEAGVQSTPTVLLDGSEFADGRTVQDIAANLVKELS